MLVIKFKNEIVDIKKWILWKGFWKIFFVIQNGSENDFSLVDNCAEIQSFPPTDDPEYAFTHFDNAFDIPIFAQSNNYKMLFSSNEEMKIIDEQEYFLLIKDKEILH